MGYNLLKKKWINAIDKNGNKVKVSIMDVFLFGHELRDIKGIDDIDISEYDIKRLLILLTMDMYRFYLRSDKRIELYREGRFNPEIVHAYFEMLKKEGVSFDLLDKEKPFLQCNLKYASEIDGFFERKCGAAVLSCRIPTESNIVFYTKDGEYGDVPVPLSTYAYYLIHTCTTAKGIGGGYYDSSIAGDEIVDLIRGENVFDTLILNCALVPEDATKPMWRWETPYDLGHVDILSGMMIPSALVRPDFDSVDEVNETIRYIYKSPVSKYEPANELKKHYKEVWLTQFEPHVSLDSSKRRIAPRKYIGLFKMCDMLGFSDENTDRMPRLDEVLNAKNIKFYIDNIGDLFNARIDIYGIDYHNAVVEWSQKIENEIPVPSIIKSADNINLVSDYVYKARKIAKLFDSGKKRESKGCSYEKTEGIRCRKKESEEIIMKKFLEYAEDLFREILIKISSNEEVSSEELDRHYLSLQRHAVKIFRENEISSPDIFLYSKKEKELKIAIHNVLHPKVKDSSGK